MKHIKTILGVVAVAAIMGWSQTGWAVCETVAGNPTSECLVTYMCGCTSADTGCVVTNAWCNLFAEPAQGTPYAYALVVDRAKTLTVMSGPKVVCELDGGYGPFWLTPTGDQNSGYQCNVTDGTGKKIYKLALRNEGYVNPTAFPAIPDANYVQQKDAFLTQLTTLGDTAVVQGNLYGSSIAPNPAKYSDVVAPLTQGNWGFANVDNNCSSTSSAYDFIATVLTYLNGGKPIPQFTGAKVLYTNPCTVGVTLTPPVVWSDVQSFYQNTYVKALQSIGVSFTGLEVTPVVAPAVVPACLTAEEATSFAADGAVAIMGMLGKLTTFVQNQKMCMIGQDQSQCTVQGAKLQYKADPDAALGSVLITVTPAGPSLDAALQKLGTTYAADQNKLDCYKEVLSQTQNVYVAAGAPLPDQPVDSKPNDGGLKVAMCQSTIFDCEKMVKIGDGKAGSQDKMMMFLINGGKYNQVISVMDGGAFFMFDPMDLKKVFACKSDDAMLGMGSKEDGSSKYVAWIDSVNDKTRVRIVNGRPVALLKKVINDHGVSVEQQMQNDKNNIPQPPCDFSLYMKEAGLQDADVVAFPELPAGANNIADGVILDDKFVLLLQDKSDQAGVVKGVAVYDFSGATPVADYRALPVPYVDKPKSSDRIVARSLKDGVEVVMVKESDSTAVRCVLPTSGGMTCGASTINAASKNIVAGLYDKASKGVKDSDLATQLLLMSQGESLDPMTALMANIDLSKTTKLVKASLDSPDVDMKMKGDFIQAISGAIFHKIEGYGDIADVVIPTPGGTMLMRKAEGKMFPDIIDSFPAASTCYLADMDKMAGPDLVCIGSGMFFGVPKTNEKPEWTQTDVKGTGTLVLEPLYKSQEGEDHTFLWTLEQKVGDQWVDKTAMLSDRAAERPNLSFPNQTATELGSVTGVKTGKSVGAGTDALNNEVYRSTVTITDPGALKSVGVNTFSVSSSGQVSGVTQLVGTSGETNQLGGVIQEASSHSWFGAAEGGCSVLPNAPSSNFFWILVIPAFMTRIMRAAYRRK